MDFGLLRNIEIIAAVLLVFGTSLASIAHIWLIVRGFATRWYWGVATIVFPVIGQILFAWKHWSQAKTPMKVYGLAIVFLSLAFATNLIPPDLGPYVQMVDGHQHVTLTGWDKQDYSIIKRFPKATVLQMANRDVTDDTLTYLAGMELLQELDLGESRITDAGLEKLASLPGLQILRIKNVAAITDAGFSRTLGKSNVLRELDARGTRIASKTLREWKKGQPDRKYLR